MTPDLASLTSVSAVAALTLFLVAVAKPTIAATKYLQRVPLWLYAVGVSLVLTYLANRVLFTLDGNLAQLALQGVVSALTGMGFRAAAANISKPTEHSVGSVDDDGPAVDPTNLAGLWLIPTLLAAGLLIGSAVGCTAPGTGSPSVELTLARQGEAFRLAVAAVNAEIVAGRMTPARYVRLKAIVVATNAAFDAAQAHAAEVTRLRAQLAAATTPDQKAVLQVQLDVAQDQFTTVMQALTAALDAFNAARETPDDDANDGDAGAPTGPTACRICQPAGPGDRWRDQWDRLARAA